MNSSQPVSSSLESVDFGFLSSEDIRSLSVKRIQNPISLDSLQHPVPGGLYDSALGASGDTSCTTCHLNEYNCPGHVGHIDLPIPIYHPVFLPQLFVLLKGTCAYCSHFRLHSAQVDLYVCKLKLIEHGLIEQVTELENTYSGAKASRGDDDSDEEPNRRNKGGTEDFSDDLRRQRNAYVKHEIKRAGRTRSHGHGDRAKIEGSAECRRQIIKSFLGACTKPVECKNCQGISPGWRKHEFNKIFRKPLKPKAKSKMAQKGFRVSNPLVEAEKARQRLAAHKREERELDEAIDVNSEISLSSEGEGEDILLSDQDEDPSATEKLVSNTTTGHSASKLEEDELEVYVSPLEVYAIMTNLFREENAIMKMLFNHILRPSSHNVDADMFFIRTVLVPPNKFRPVTKGNEGEITEAVENSQYKDILKTCQRLSQLTAQSQDPNTPWEQQRRAFGSLQNAVVTLQDSVNSLLDATRSPLQNVRQTGIGIKQRLEKKEGLFRKNMMGKRVNFAARSVISPDPNIDTNEIGVPPVFARKLTFPEPVTNHNFYDLKQAVLNGVDKWPGASAIENETGLVVSLKTKNFEERQALANQLLAPSSTNINGSTNKKVHRHLVNGDIVLMNRQPTLHKPSMMAHRTRILPGEKTIRMHYANCKTYNADFDGDEMNMHFPQNEIARAEALDIADTDHQYLVATSGDPLRGLIQDHISMGVWLTNRDTFFDRADYYQLLCSCLTPEKDQTSSQKIETVPPAVVKPQPLWTGKQVITTVLKNLQPITHPGLGLHSRSSTPSDRWGKDSEEQTVLFRDGVLISGILDKSQLGPASGGFVHAIHEAYGHTVAGRLMSVLGRLLTKFLHMRAWTCGMEDLQLTVEGNDARSKTLEEARSIGEEVSAKYVTLDDGEYHRPEELRARLQEVLRDNVKHYGLDNVYAARNAKLSSELTALCLPGGLSKPFPYNHMQAMTVSGAKGSQVNANQISCNLGQQTLEGRRVPVMISGKTLPNFKPFETQIRAGGYITDRFLTGVKPPEYYFHAMAGREGLIDTAVKTSRSGYLQRCLIKGLEGLKTEYDRSVRDSDGSLIQFLYGEDGLDVTRQTHLTDFRFVAENYLSFAAELNLKEEFGKIDDVAATEYQKRALKRYHKTGRLDCMDPVLSIYNPGVNLGSTSEKFASALKKYCDENPDGLIKEKDKQLREAVLGKRSFIALLNIKYLKSLVEPGEAVGLVGSQSIGEPSTQMTLNTFHLAGHASKNVTLGIPRLREIVMTASQKISTPLMTLYLLPELTEDAAKIFAKGITRLALGELIDKVHVNEVIDKGIGYEKAKIYNVHIELYPATEYCETYAITVDDVLRALEFQFVPRLARSIKKELTKRGDGKLLSASAARPDIGVSSGKDPAYTGIAKARAKGAADDAAADGDDEAEDDDATNDKQRRNRDAAISYDDPDEGEAMIRRQAEREATPIQDDDIDSAMGGSPKPTLADADEMQDDKTLQARKEAASRSHRIQEKSPAVTQFSFDPVHGEWCKIQFEYDSSTSKLLLLPLVETACHETIIQSVPDIGNCTLTKEDVRDPATKTVKEIPVVETEGVNLRAMHHYQDIIDPHRIKTNDVWAMMQTYGVEAGRDTIIREMSAVFGGHGISVDNRHLNLIADYMTKEGQYKPFSRIGIASSVSPFQKASFESTMAYLRDAVLDGDWDDLKNPSARIVTGKLSGVGTGAFDVLMPIPQ